MAESKFQTTQFTADQFVESAGAILFQIARQEVCLVHHRNRNEWLLAKGRRNIGEARLATALREATEETGYECEPMRLNMVTRAPPAIEILQHYPDEPRVHEMVTEPFMMTHRHFEGKKNFKIIWWYAAAIRGSTDNDTITRGKGEVEYEAGLFGFDEALAKLTYKSDQDILREAIRLFETSRIGQCSGDRDNKQKSGI